MHHTSIKHCTQRRQSCKVRHREIAEIAARKTVFNKDDPNGTKVSAWREVCILSRLKHKHIVRLRTFSQDIDETSGHIKFYLVLDFCDFDLTFLRKKVKFSPGGIHKVRLCIRLFL